MSFCCPPFTALLQNAGGRGIAIVLKGFSTGHKFFLQSRAVCHADQDEFVETCRQNSMRSSVLVNLVCQQGISCCPFCGKNLDDVLLEASPDELASLVATHKSFF